MPLKNISVVQAIGIAGILIVGLWASWYLPNLRVQTDTTSAPDLLAASGKMQPLVEALEKYRADNGFYPTALEKLNANYRSAKSGNSGKARMAGILYSAHTEDWILESEACGVREKSLYGWVMERSEKYRKDIAQFKLECVKGYRRYELQSEDFPSDQQSNRIERWAFYDSQQKEWKVGWCSHNGRGSRTGMNGDCRW